ncbi:MAG: DUF742 domain-containing protein [Micromonosporaceae bacterium]
MSSSKDRWLDREAGPVVRLYALTQGRTRPAGRASLDLIDVVEATGLRPTEVFRPSPEHRRILSLCARAVSIADLASEIDLPIGVVRVLLGDLIHQGLIKVYSPASGEPASDDQLLRKLLDGLQAL